MFALETVNNHTNDLYKKKYLKYKQKYIELKQHGGFDSVEKLAEEIKPLEDLKKKVINETNLEIEKIGNTDTDRRGKFAGYLAREHKDKHSKSIYDLLLDNKIIKEGPKYIVMDPKKLEDDININSFNELLDALDTYQLEPIKDTSYTTLGQVFKDILIFKDQRGPKQNTRFTLYNNHVLKIIEEHSKFNPKNN